VQSRLLLALEIKLVLESCLPVLALDFVRLALGKGKLGRGYADMPSTMDSGTRHRKGRAVETLYA